MSFADFPRSAYAGGTAIVPVVYKKKEKKLYIEVVTMSHVSEICMRLVVLKF